ncbi:GIY-YIG nuclease family protein [Corynebacterium lizhenjunii]|uniref:GIY-YIG nuclease family protein n=1 Tax=Corynebacterium lizhenjunii TaxID=2709394 RepID=A0A7T0KF45_9CORY|nr:GIY-YIG nuclease family protein [Corynebacterium lizhenjunii]QPK79641.1 GIY-YIG nuclease family protein [Corynebacterium lizhenjunii]
MSHDPLMDQLDQLMAADTDGLLDMPEEPRPVTELDRLVRAFGEINNFYAEHGHEPSPDTLSIAERKLGARLTGIRASEQKIAELLEHDVHGLLQQQPAPQSLDELMASDSLGLVDDPTGLLDTSTLPTRKSPEEDGGERAVRVKAKDFEAYAQHFSAKHAGLADGSWALTKFTGESSIREGRFFVINGVMCFVADVKEPQISRGETKPRLRVVFENGTESAMYRESLSNRLYETGGQALTRTTMSGDEIGDADEETGYLYILKSLSEHPDIRSLDNLYKIGFTRGTVDARIAGAEKSPTYLMAPVEVVASYKAYNLRPSALEHLLHRVFAAARLDATVVNRAGGSVSATEWFVVPLPIIDKAIELILSGEIVDYVYNPSVGDLVRR